jgi:hypothetical protein
MSQANKTVTELKAYAKANGIKGYSNKNKGELLRLIEEYPKNNINNFTVLPKVIIPEIRKFLNFDSSKALSVTDKKLSTGDIFKFKLCASITGSAKYKNLAEYEKYKTGILAKINILHKHSPKLQFLKLEYDLRAFSELKYTELPDNDEEEYSEERFVIGEMIQILNAIKRFTQLLGLQIYFNYRLYDVNIVENNYPLFTVLNNFNLEFLSTDLDFHIYKALNIVLQNPALKYLELKSAKFDGDPDIPENKVHTISILDEDTRNLNFSLQGFKNCKRVIFEFIDYLILEELAYTPDLEVLEFNKYVYQVSYSDYLDALALIPKSIRYLRTRDIENIADIENKKNLYGGLLEHLQNLEYIYIDDSIHYYDEFLRFLQITLQYKIKYLYIRKLYLEFLEEQDQTIIDTILTLLQGSNIQFGFGELYNSEFLPLADKFKWNFRSKGNNKFYALQDYQYTPESWLVNNGFMLKPTCG